MIPGWTRLFPWGPRPAPRPDTAPSPLLPELLWGALCGTRSSLGRHGGSEGRLPAAGGPLLTLKAQPMSPDSPGAETPGWWSQPHVRPPLPLPPSGWVWSRGRRDRRKPSLLRVSGNFRAGLTSSSSCGCRHRCARWGGSHQLETRRERPGRLSPGPPNRKNKSLICLSRCGWGFCHFRPEAFLSGTPPIPTIQGDPRASGGQIRDKPLLARGSATPGSHEARLRASSWPPCSPSIPDSQREPDLPRHAGPGHDTRLRPAPLGPSPANARSSGSGKDGVSAEESPRGGSSDISIQCQNMTLFSEILEELPVSTSSEWMEWHSVTSAKMEGKGAAETDGRRHDLRAREGAPQWAQGRREGRGALSTPPRGAVVKTGRSGSPAAHSVLSLLDSGARPGPGDPLASFVPPSSWALPIAHY